MADSTGAPKSINLSDPSHAIVLFDGVCNLCNSSVNFMIDRDKKGYLKFAAQQSEAGQAVLSQLGITVVGDPDSILLVQNGVVYERSGAALRIARKLSFPWFLLYAGIIVPWFLRDFVYKWIARNRYRWFGKKESCRIPTPELRARFL